MSTVFVIVYFETLEDMNLVKQHLECLNYSMTTEEHNKTLTLESVFAFQFVQQFCAIFDIEMTFWVAIYK